jgi:hypothetical protein
MSDLTGMGDRRGMKLWSWLGAVEIELLTNNPQVVAALLTPDLLPRVIRLGPETAKWLTAVAEAAQAIERGGAKQ